MLKSGGQSVQNSKFVTAAMRSEFYRRKLQGCSLRWDDIPFTEKHELRDADPFSLLGTSLENIASYHETSGTTGRPTPSWYSYRDVDNEARIVVESDLKLSPQDFLLNRLTFTVAVASFIGLWAAQRAKCGHVSMAKSGISTPLRVLDVMDRTHPTIIMEIPFELELLAGVRDKLQRPIPKTLRALLVAGELVSPARKRWLEKLWGVPVFGLFGSTETGGLFMTCHKGHYHVDNPNVLIEVVDEQRRPVGFDHPGELVVSTLREGMPVLRFANHDRVELKPASYCECGNPHPVLIHYGRSEDVMWIAGKPWSFYDVQEVVYGMSHIPMLWRMQVNPSSITFMYMSNDLSPNHQMEHAIREELESSFGVSVEVKYEELVSKDELLRPSSLTKFKYFA
jgi:phenylacetate-CoA ligase